MVVLLEVVYMVDLWRSASVFLSVFHMVSQEVLGVALSLSLVLEVE